MFSLLVVKVFILVLIMLKCVEVGSGVFLGMLVL